MTVTYLVQCQQTFFIVGFHLASAKCCSGNQADVRGYIGCQRYETVNSGLLIQMLLNKDER